MANPSHVRQIVGAPFVPPPLLTRAVTRVRAGLLWSHRRTAPPALRVVETVFALFDNRVLGLVVELDLPELLDRPRTVEELAKATGSNADALARVLRYAAGRGFVTWRRSGRYQANQFTRVLRRDNVNSWRGWAEFGASDWFWDSWRHADAAVRGDSNGIKAATGHSFFDYVTTVRPEAGRTFNDAMRAGSVLQAVALAEGLEWQHVRRLCDVGGGTGGALEHLLEAHAHIEGTLFDLPAVVADARPGLVSGALATRCRIEGGSFFDRVPEGHDRYLLLAVVHDWADEEAAAILRTVAASVPDHGEIVVVESVLSDTPTDEFAAASDLLMLVLASGRERTRAQFEELFSTAGLTLTAATPLATGFTAFRLHRR